MKVLIVGFTAALAIPTTAGAHAGHSAGMTPPGWMHYLSDPYHLLVGLTAAVCVVAVWQVATRVIWSGSVTSSGGSSVS